MMMAMLQAGGIPLLADGHRCPDESNPGGYHEFAPVLDSRSSTAWLSQAAGKAVKVIYALLDALPADRPYRVLFMMRDLSEIVRSQRAFLARSGKEMSRSDAEFAAVFERERDRCLRWLEGQDHFDVLRVPYASVLDDPTGAVREVASFLARPLDEMAMARVVDARLCRFSRSRRPDPSGCGGDAN